MKGWIVIGAVALGLFLFIQNAKNDRTHVLNLRSSGFFGDYVSGVLLTEGSSGQIYLWVEMNGKMMCPKTTFIQSNVRTPFEFQCSSMDVSGGSFTVMTNRNPPDWVRQNAQSL